jgi:hypothetical protein
LVVLVVLDDRADRAEDDREETKNFDQPSPLPKKKNSTYPNLLVSRRKKIKDLRAGLVLEDRTRHIVNEDFSISNWTNVWR